MDFVTVLYTVTAKVGSEKQLEAAMKSIVTQTREEPGCGSYELHVDESDPLTFRTYEHWTSKEALEAHFKTPYVLAMNKDAASLVQGDLKAGMKLLKVIRP